MEYIPQLMTLLGVVTLACMTPGPDFVAVTSYALVERRNGISVALGITLAVAMWATLAIMGLGLLMAKLAWLYEAIRIVGALFLIYLGARMLLASIKGQGSTPNALVAAPVRRSPFRVGFLVGITNPKTAMFFASLFVMLLPAAAPIWLYVITVALVSAITCIWLMILALSFSAPAVRSAYARIRRPIDALMGAALMALGTKLAITR